MLGFKVPISLPRQAGAMVIFSMGNKDLAKFLVAECGQQGVLTLAL